jgi:RNA polymerase sigma-70 factor (ECF subfamily)
MSDALATFLEHRPYLLGVAYRMLGSAADAEDVTQEAFVRWQAETRDDVASPRAYLTTIVTRLAIDQLASAKRRRETYVGPWLPEPVRTDGAHPNLESHDVSSLSVAFLVVLEALSPLERAAFLMREVFDYDHAEIARVLGRDEAAVRQLVHRAKEHVRDRRPRFASSKEAHLRMLQSFLATVATGEIAPLEALLAEGVVATSDGGGRVTAARKPVHGRHDVARLALGLAKKASRAVPSIVEINGNPAVVLVVDGELIGVVDLEVDDDQIVALHLIVNPEKLGALRAAL